MSRDLSRKNVLTMRYGAQVSEGNYRWRETMPAYVNYLHGEKNIRDFDIQTTEVRSIQVDFHPADFERLVDALEYLHDVQYQDTSMTASQRLVRSQSPSTGYAEHLYKKQWREEELRRNHPLLQDLWQQYQMTLNLIASGQPIGTE